MNDNIASKTSQKPVHNYFTFAHIAGVLTVIVAYIAIFSITGDSDLFWALGSGMGVWLVAWAFATMHWHRKSN